MTTASHGSTRLRHLLNEAVVPLAAIAYAIVFMLAIRGLPPEATIFPRTILTVLAILGVLIMATEALKTPGEGPRSNPRAYAMFGLAVLFVIAMGVAGYLVAAMSFLLISLLFLRQRWLVSLLVSVGLPCVIYLLFTVAFGISL